MISIQRERGFTLIEVLVAILIVAVGILGVAGMQVVSLQQNRNALFRDTALQLGNDIIDRIRANATEAYSGVTPDSAPTLSANCNDAACTTEEMRDFDVAQWKCRLDPLDGDGAIHGACATIFNINPADPAAPIPSSALPGGRGGIVIEGETYVVTIDWLADRDGNRSEVVLRALLPRQI